jgi:hypothetical protein
MNFVKLLWYIKNEPLIMILNQSGAYDWISIQQKHHKQAGMEPHHWQNTLLYNVCNGRDKNLSSGFTMHIPVP